MFPALDPLTIREKKAKEIFLLFKRASTLNEYINKNTKNPSNIKNSKPESIDVTGLDTGWYVWFILTLPLLNMLLSNTLI